jgi:PmbA protein
MKYDILTLNEETLSIEVVGGKINSFRNKNITKKGVRLFENNKIFNTSFVGEIDNKELVSIAQASLSVGIPYDYSLPKYKTIEVVDDESFKAPLGSIQEAIDETMEGLTKYSNEFVFNGKFNRTMYTRTLEDDQGSLLTRKFAHNEWYFLFKKVGSPQLMDGYFEESGRVLNPHDVLEKNMPYLDSYSKEVSFTAGRYPVLFLESGSLLYKLAESFRAEKYCEGSALYSNKLGKEIFSKDFSLYDVNYSPAHGLYGRFDGEGTVRKHNRLPLIEKGVMRNIIADLRTAKKYGIESTGNGQRSPESAVTTDFHSLVFGAGRRTTQEILNKLDKCIIVFMGHGRDFTDKGDFSTPLQLSYLVERGEIIGRLPQLTVNTTISDMFNSRLIEIASDGFQKNTLNPSIFTEMDVALN